VFDATHSVQLPGGQGERLRRAARNRAGPGPRAPSPPASPDSSWRRIPIPTKRASRRSERLAARPDGELLHTLRDIDHLVKQQGLIETTL
jgi:hypothetical protein